MSKAISEAFVMKLLILILCCSSSFLPKTEAAGLLHIEMLRYHNHDSRSSDGQFCDTVMNIFKLNGCDPVFRLMLDSDSIGGTNLFDYKTSDYHESDTINFGSRFGSIGNPIRVKINFPFTGRVKMRVDVTDHDYDAHDHIDTFSASLQTGSKQGIKSLSLKDNGHTLSLKYWFTCNPHYYGDMCNDYCEAKNDIVNGHYFCDSDGNKICLTGWIKSSLNCKERHPCSSTELCKNGGTCVQAGESYSCICAEDFSGRDCSNYTHPCIHRNPCVNGGQCSLIHNSSSDVQCSCPSQFHGPYCQYDVNECDANPCHNNQTCVNSFGSFACNCSRQFTGDLCELDVNECSETDQQSAACKNNATCVNVYGNFSCLCPSGWTGHTCNTDVNECQMVHPCRNNATCVNEIGDYKCLCLHQFTGRNCELHKCASLNCANNGECRIDTKGKAQCNCRPGFSGSECRTNVDDCLGSPCRNGATCIDGDNSFTCRCRPGFVGKVCDINVDDCQPNPCRNNGNCSDGQNHFTCACADGFYGDVCEFERSPIGPKAIRGTDNSNAAAAAAAASTTAGAAIGSTTGVIFIIVLAFILIYFLIRRRNQLRTRELQNSDESQSGFENPVYATTTTTAAAEAAKHQIFHIDIDHRNRQTSDNTASQDTGAATIDTAASSVHYHNAIYSAFQYASMDTEFADFDSQFQSSSSEAAAAVAAPAAAEAVQAAAEENDIESTYASIEYDYAAETDLQATNA